MYPTPKSLEKHNSLTITSNLVVLKPAISLKCIEHYYAVCFYVWYDVNFAYTMFVCIATSSSKVTSHLKTKLVWYLGSQVYGKLCPWSFFSLPNNIPINHCDMLRLIWWDLIGLPSIVYATPCRQMNYWVVLLLLYLVLGN